MLHVHGRFVGNADRSAELIVRFLVVAPARTAPGTPAAAQILSPAATADQTAHRIEESFRAQPVDSVRVRIHLPLHMTQSGVDRAPHPLPRDALRAVLPHHPDGALTHLGGILRRSSHGPILSTNTPSANPGTSQSIWEASAVAIVWVVNET
jgi:hypothetical protein